jgi:uracil-DNA glycosylase
LLSHKSFTELFEFDPSLERVVKDIDDFLAAEKAAGHTVFPPEDEIFTALNLTSLNEVKALILGQDPYHDDNQAHGLAFSVREGTKMPPSLRNIFKELKSDLGITANTTELTRWAEQGVLLLNTVLTVRAHTPGSHRKHGWEILTDAIVKYVNLKSPHCAFVLWGRDAWSKEPLIDTEKHLIIKSVHPSPLSASRGFFGSHPFSRINDFLLQNGIAPIDWNLEKSCGQGTLF